MNSTWRLADLIRPDVLSAARSDWIVRKAPQITRAARVLADTTSANPEVHLIWVPGRIEVLGKHTDYAGGRSLLAATDNGLVIVAAARSDRTILVMDAVAGLRFGFSLDEIPDIPEGGWRAYFATVARRLDDNFQRLSRGAELAFASDLPAAAGLSSSSALIVGTFLALARANSLDEREDYRRALPTTEALAEYLGAVESGYPYGILGGVRGVGTFGGSEDHTAILCGRPGYLVQYRYSPIRFEKAIALPQRLVFTVATSGVRAEKTGAAQESYNRLSLLSREAARLWSETTGRDLPHLGAILAEDRQAVAEFRSFSDFDGEGTYPISDLLDRVEHFHQESEIIVPQATAALEGGDLERFGALVDRSMRLAETLLGNQVPETSYLAATARRLGAVAASAFGAGFGGAVWALVSASEAEKFKQNLKESYCRAFPRQRRNATFFLTKAGPPAMEIVPES